jgi:hypothetical protein
LRSSKTSWSPKRRLQSNSWSRLKSGSLWLPAITHSQAPILGINAILLIKKRKW